MKTKYILLVGFAIIAMPMSAQIFNFSLQTNSQQLIDEALSGAFVKITQSYRLYDTINDEYLGRNGADYFNKVPFLGIKTERGLIVPSTVEQPWTCDEDFNKYQGKYKPILSESSLSPLNAEPGSTIPIHTPFTVVDEIDDGISIVNDSTYCDTGLKVDSISGHKNGWFIWLSSNNFDYVDSIRLTSISEAIEVPDDGKSIDIDPPGLWETAETVYGGIYVTPIQTAIGEVSLYVTGYMVEGNDGWKLIFPFVKTGTKEIMLTPIDNGLGNFNPSKSKKKRK